MEEGEEYLEWEGTQSLVIYGTFPEMNLIQGIPEGAISSISEGRYSPSFQVGGATGGRGE